MQGLLYSCSNLETFFAYVRCPFLAVQIETFLSRRHRHHQHHHQLLLKFVTPLFCAFTFFLSLSLSLSLVCFCRGVVLESEKTE